jgi:hypothetical protein
MRSDTFYCPLLSKDIANPLCLSITYAAEGRQDPDEIPDVNNWEQAKDICADCGNAYWNKNNLDPPDLPEELD